MQAINGPRGLDSLLKSYEIGNIVIDTN